MYQERFFDCASRPEIVNDRFPKGKKRRDASLRMTRWRGVETNDGRRSSFASCGDIRTEEDYSPRTRSERDSRRRIKRKLLPSTRISAGRGREL
jgi:hypothetical protein